MIDHVGIKITDPKKSRRFYDEALRPIGYEMLMEIPQEYTNGKVVLGYGVSPRAHFWINEDASKGSRIHLAFRAVTRQQVDDFYKLAIAAGGTDNGAPGLRPHYHKDYYGAFVLDPDGHNIEVVCRNPS